MKRIVAGVLALTVAFASMAHAAPTLITPEQVAAAAAGRDVDADRALVQRTLARAELQSKLREMGVDPDAVAQRVDALSDSEVSALAAKIESAPAGGTDVLGFVLVVFLVLLVTDILGFTHIFPFVKHGSGRAR